MIIRLAKVQRVVDDMKWIGNKVNYITCTVAVMKLT